MGVVILVIGSIIAVVGGLMLLIETFRESVVWGLASLFIGPVSLIFVILHWDVAKKPFLIQLAGICIAFLGVALGATEVTNV